MTTDLGENDFQNLAVTRTETKYHSVSGLDVLKRRQDRHHFLVKVSLKKEPKFVENGLNNVIIL